MATEYLYGTYGQLADSVVQATAEASTVALYVGTAPVNLIRGYADKGIINAPVKLSNGTDARSKIGMASNWTRYTLSEAVAAHFGGSDNVGPIYVINVLNPATHRKSDPTTMNLNFVNGKATFASEDIILDTFTLADKAEGTDYNIAYSFTTGKVTILSADEENPLTGAIAASFYEVDTTAITEDDIVGVKTAAGQYTGLQAADLLYPNYGVVISLLGAPGWSDKPAVYKELVSKATKLNGHWDGFVYADIPLSYSLESYSEVTPETGASPKALGYYELVSGAYVLSEDTEVDTGKTYYTKTTATTYNDTIQKALAWKTANAYNDERSKIFYPQAHGTDGNIYHLSTLALAETMRLDISHGGVPMESCGNKSVAADKQYFGDQAVNAGFDVTDASALCEKGIDTLIFWGGAWKLWGDHTAAYDFANTDIDPRDIFDVSMRMLLYLTNAFQVRWASVIDQPFTVQMKDTILVREQERLDSLVAGGALIGKPRISFEAENNTLEDMRNGRFRWDLQVTPTPPLKSASAFVAYTDEGFSAYVA